MFGYVVMNQQEMKIKDFLVYRSYYCGFCQELKKYGLSGRLTLSYDMTFLILLLTGLYEPDTEVSSCKCIAHPLEKHPTRRNAMTSYAADMNILLTYDQCMDDWQDEKKYTKLLYARLLSRKKKKIEDAYPEKAARIRRLLEDIHKAETSGETDIDKVSGCFGEIMAEIFVCRRDEWEEELRRLGFFLGKFIYLMDAYEDVEKDIDRKNYNPLIPLFGKEDFEQNCNRILTMMMAECCKAFERLPILENADTLRNILYSGVWCRYELVTNRRKETKNV